MPIGNAIQRDGRVYVYDTDNRLLFSKDAGRGPDEGLKGYTSSTVNIQRDSIIWSYNEQGNQTGVRQV